ncbi:hypothetical protein L249_3567 [Ophiocordyceps polyrhachis-furcata BCC 54312]|uniref:Uncharacterized protein n=1 Tax=Ophiocordyceps polyrhachis-furcata BCC 54312 TaxID=1330021 RepID=A0A367LM10_9HYPO|nr:hypothetical protein L249_3567 [Ophiocordyceps polyrhachis-furcata BCC 54312]
MLRSTVGGLSLLPAKSKAVTKHRNGPRKAPLSRSPVLAEGKRHPRKFDCLVRPPFLGSLTYPTFLPSYGPYGPYGRSRSSVTYGGLGPAAAGPASLSGAPAKIGSNSIT